VIPVAQWGPHQILAYGEKRPKLFPRKTMVMQAGPPVDLADLRGLPQTAETLKEATDRIMDAITVQLVAIRGEEPPAVRFAADGEGNGDSLDARREELGSSSENDPANEANGETSGETNRETSGESHGKGTAQ
jgi:hypothetical protein